MAINFLAGISVNGELTTTGATNNITTTNATSTLYLLNLTRTSTSLTTAGNVGINGATSVDSPLDIAAASTSNNALFQKWYYAPNNETYSLQLKQTVSSGVVRYNFSMVNANTAYNDVLVLDRGNVGIGTTSPSKKLHVKESTSSTYAAYIENTIAGGDYLAMVGDAGDNVFEFNSSGTGGEAEMKMYSDGVLKVDINADGDSYFNGGKVGIVTTSPSTTLHVSSGYLRVEGVGCGIQMPDTSGNPLLALTTDQNTFAGCNIVNGWGNSSNTGVGVGTTRSDGLAFQVRTGITLSSGIATSSGTQRLIVYGSGGTKLTKSLGVGTSNPSNTTGRIDASNDIVAYSSSDIRLKDNIKSIDKALDKVNKIQGIEFDWIEKEEVHGNSGHDVGVIAQEIEKVLPEVVDTRDNGYKAVKYEKLVPLLIEAIKDLSKQVDGLKRLI